MTLVPPNEIVSGDSVLCCWTIKFLDNSGAFPAFVLIEQPEIDKKMGRERGEDMQQRATGLRLCAHGAGELPRSPAGQYPRVVTNLKSIP